ncbi:phosphatidylinositol glycan anchor biosynthesis protein [Aphelenchoides avenae]|nr:phosphatidylinositol glycan anchor biosynthesis protein [Aphelenchus avenae]
MWLHVACLLLAILALTLLFHVLRNPKRLPVTENSRCLLVIAHPDDEAMFFGPTVHQLTASGCSVFVLCLTAGNADGLGATRKKELASAVTHLGVRRENLTVLDMSSYQDGQAKWEIEKLSSVILHHLEKLDISFVITFDEKGVSGHPNHSSCFFTLQFLYTNGHIPAGVQVFVLESVRLYRKYIGFLDSLRHH